MVQIEELITLHFKMLRYIEIVPMGSWNYNYSEDIYND